MATDISDPPVAQSKPKPLQITTDGWGHLVGEWSVENDRVVYNGPGDRDVGPGYGISRSSHRFRDGSVSSKVTLSRVENTSAGILIGFQSTKRPAEVSSATKITNSATGRILQNKFATQRISASGVSRQPRNYGHPLYYRGISKTRKHLFKCQVFM